MLQAHSTFTVSQETGNQRLDQFLTKQLPLLSRTSCQRLIDQGAVSINGIIATKHSIIIKPFDSISIIAPEPTPLPESKPVPSNLSINTLFEHSHFLAISKPANLMVHAPSTVNTVFTLVDWLVAHFKEISSIGSPERPGIVHRLDKDTSGVILVAKNSYGLMMLGDLFKNRLIRKTYLAIVQGTPPAQGTIATLIDNHPVIKTKKMVSTKNGKQAITHFRVLEYFKDHAYLELKPVTGRTHQLRVHCASIGHPIIGDTVYGRQSNLITRHALHAAAIAFEFLGNAYTITAPLAHDMHIALDALRDNTAKKA